MIISPNFDYGKFAIIRNQSGLNSFKESVKDQSEANNCELILRIFI